MTDLAMLAQEVRQNLSDQILAMWFPRAIDPAGGYHQNFAEDWTRIEKNDRSVVYQSRLVWVAAQAARYLPDQTKSYEEYARHGMEYLKEKLWDGQDGGLFWGLDETGAPVRGGEKHAYGISFAIYAAAGDYKSTQDPDALTLAQDAYHWLDSHAHDAAHGGYYEAMTRDGQCLLAAPGARRSDALGTHYGCKSMNTHIHLLESFSALYEIWPDAGLRARLEEVFAIVRDKIAVESVGCLNYLFTADWRALPDHDSFGHDVETAYLLVEASGVLGRPDDERTWQLARRIVDHALDYGWDREHGGFYDAGSVFGRLFHAEKIWWVQAEGLNALLLIHTRYGKESLRYWDAFLKQWEFIQKHQIDAQNGGWYATVSREGVAAPGRIKSDGWTEAYHQGRALMNVAAELKHLAQ